jgi:hypothetical protein
MEPDGKESKRGTNRCFVYVFYEDKYRTELYYPLIESILIESNDCFSCKNIEVLNRLSALCPDRESFSQVIMLKPL